jgi:SAM-dependent methyltransferase
MDCKAHWNQAYETNPPDDVSWYQKEPTLSLRLIARTCVGKSDGILDVGGGASVLVDCLLAAGFENVAVLDISGSALDHARRRLDPRAEKVGWFEADITAFRAPRPFALWHDRAVFHFLTDPADRQRYVNSLRDCLTTDGHVIIATFAVDGPPKCSGLEVARYDAPGISAELGADFRLIEQVDETHVTPWNTRQQFSYFRFIRKQPGD